jgi:hypothetical protein
MYRNYSKTLFKSTGKEDIPEYKFINERNRVELFSIIFNKVSKVRKNSLSEPIYYHNKNI